MKKFFYPNKVDLKIYSKISNKLPAYYAPNKELKKILESKDFYVRNL